MARKRSENRNRAYEIYQEYGGNITNRAIADKLNISEKTVGGWKCKDKWDDNLNGVLHSNKRSTPKKKKPRGAPEGNKNAAGHGAPHGNTNAVVTGEHETIWLDMLDEDEQGLVQRINNEPIAQIDEAINLLTIRERRMLARIQNLKVGLSEKQRRVLQELRNVKEPITVYDEKSGTTQTVTQSGRKLVVTEIEEEEIRLLDDILRLEEALTRIQDKKIKAINVKNQLLKNKGKDNNEGSVTTWLDLMRRAAEEDEAEADGAEQQTDQRFT